MQIRTARLVLRDFTEADAPAFVAYQSDPRYLALHAAGAADPSHARELFARFARWRDEAPRRNYQLGVFVRDAAGGALVGCAGLRDLDRERAIAQLGIELAPDYWGRYRLAIEVAQALLDTAFEHLALSEISGVTASSNARVSRLAQWFGAEPVATREGPGWMQARGWWEVEWRISRAAWARTRPSIARKSGA
jgi:RimJ/RimL family protein N-acetyltransferase